MQKLAFIITLVLIQVFTSFLCLAQSNKNYYVEKRLYSFKDGLSGRIVKQAIQDNKGFMWFVTNNGLCRFDGKIFIKITKKSHGLFSNNISSIVSDNKNAIIICYFNDYTKYSIEPGQIDVLNINTLKIKKLKDYYNNIPFKDSDIYEVRSDPDDYQHIYFALKPLSNIQNIAFLTTKMWTLNAQGQFKKHDVKITKTIKFVLQGKLVNAVIEPFTNATSLSDKAFIVINDTTINSINANSAGANYKNNKGGFLISFNDSINQKFYYLKNFSTITEIKSSDTTFPNFTFDFKVKYFYNRMNYCGVVCNYKNTLCLYQKNKELITLIDSTDTDEIKNAKIQSVFKDKIGNYWLASSEGVIKITIKKNKFNTLFTNKQIPFGLNNSTRGFYKYNDTLLVAALDFIGIKTKNKTTLFKNDYNINFAKIGNKLLVAAGSLTKIDIKTQQKISLANQSLGEIWSIYPLNKNQILLGCSGNIGMFNVSTNHLNIISTGNFKKPNITYKFLPIKNNILAVSANGIYVINKQGKIIDCYNQYQTNINKRLPINEINDLYIDKDSLYWICSAFNGLYCWDRKNNKLQQFGVENGFLSLTHYRMEEDAYNNLWISTDFGLTKFNKITKQATVYTEKDGVPSNEFNRVSSFKDNDGTLYFGGMNGVTYFNPKYFFEEDDTHNYPFVVYNLSIYNIKTNLIEDETNNFYKNNSIVLNKENRNVTLQVALLDFEDRIHLYAYQTIGLEKEWNYTSEGLIKLNNLPYGNYILKIKAQCVNGAWNKTELLIPIIIPTPFYKTWWFLVIILVVVTTLVIAFVKQRLKILQKQNQKLERVVEERTAELKSSLAEQITLLQEVHHRVKNNLQFIAAMLKMQLNTIKDESNQKILKETSRRINAMSLVHEMLYNKEKLEYVSVKEYLSELINKLEELVYDAHEKITFNLEIDNVKFNINNCVSIGMITSEIISNTIKYAFEKTNNACITIKLSVISSEEVILYTVADNGKGMKEGTSNNGLGLRLIDIFSRQMEASYEIKNDNGVKYIFKIPYTVNEN